MDRVKIVPMECPHDKEDRKADVDDLIFCEGSEWYISDR